VARIGIIATLIGLITLMRVYGANWDNAFASLPFTQSAAAAPASVASIGKAAAPSLPDTDFKTWFSTDPSVDPYDAPTWTAIAAMTANAGDQPGWTQVCKKVDSAAGADRTANPLLGALACSDSPAVTALQQFAVDLLSAQAMVALWVDHAPGTSTAAIAAREAQIRTDCATIVPAAQGDASSPLSTACSRAADTAYLSGDAKTTFTALGDAYALVAAEIAKESPKVAQDPVYFDTKK